MTMPTPSRETTKTIQRTDPRRPVPRRPASIPKTVSPCFHSNSYAQQRSVSSRFVFITNCSINTNLDDEESTAGTATSAAPTPAPLDTNPDLMWPTMQDLNTRLRRVITSYQRNYKKEELKQQQKAKVSATFGNKKCSVYSRNHLPQIIQKASDSSVWIAWLSTNIHANSSEHGKCNRLLILFLRFCTLQTESVFFMLVLRLVVGSVVQISVANIRPVRTLSTSLHCVYALGEYRVQKAAQVLHHKYQIPSTLSLEPTRTLAMYPQHVGIGYHNSKRSLVDLSSH